MNYTKDNPFFASIKERTPLSKPGSKKLTQHIVLDLRESGLIYEAGDSLGILPEHDPLLVNQTLQALKMEGHEQVFFEKLGIFLSIREFLRKHANITDISPKLFRQVIEKQRDPDKKNHLSKFLEPENNHHYKEFLSSHEVWDFLQAHNEVDFLPQECVGLLAPLLPRFYSIASSQKYANNEVHLTVAPVEYEANGHKRRGVCTHYICELVPLHEPVVPIFIQQTHNFRLPQDPHANPLIMIGPGTGVAPFRAFMQERLVHHRSTNKHWLFFGEWNQKHDFFYESDWNDFQTFGHLTIDLAFSRDQEEKIYVQHKMWEKGKLLFDWLEQNAYLYVCGDASRMAKDVEKMLLAIICEYGQKSEIEAREYIKKMRQQKRYLRDIY